MNVFKSLDTLFPVGPQRTSGEVVGVTLIFVHNGEFVSNLHWKRKAWYVNASVNAFHMHRGLVREFCDLNVHEWLSTRQSRAVRRLIAHAVLFGYVRNYYSGSQHSTFQIYTADGGDSASMYCHDRLLTDQEYADGWEVVDFKQCSLEYTVYRSVMAAKSYASELKSNGPSN